MSVSFSFHNECHRDSKVIILRYLGVTYRWKEDAMLTKALGNAGKVWGQALWDMVMEYGKDNARPQFSCENTTEPPPWRNGKTLFR